MPRVCGPILGFRGQDAGTGLWRLTVMVVHRGADQPGALSVTERGGSAVTTEPLTSLAEVAGLRFFGAEFAVPLRDAAYGLDYVIGDDGGWAFTVPAAGASPRIAFASCNDFSDPRDMKTIEDKNALWTGVAKAHADEPFHLLLMGGDQIYADALWHKVAALDGFDEMTRAARIAHPAGPEAHAAIAAFYVDLYRERFSQPPVAHALASIPTLMMWDDHDIFDGWGSYTPEEQGSDVFKAVFAAARTAFALYQLQSIPEAPAWPRLAGQDAFNALLRIGDIGVLVLDLRSQRTRTAILQPDTWNVVLTALDGTGDLKHLLVMSSIPLVHPDLSFLERTLDILPGGQALEDDLHDQWVGYGHRVERLRLIRRLLDFADAQGTRVTILSGDVHIGALGVIEALRAAPRYPNANVINQLTSSGIVHPPPPRFVQYFLEQLAMRVDDLDGTVQARMLQFPGTNHHFLGARNWLSLDFDDQYRIWANWHVEGVKEALTKVIYPCMEQSLRR